MDDLAPLALPALSPPRTPRRLTDAQVRIIRLSLARSCTDAEFDHFIAVSERTGLDPLRRQISAIVIGASDPDKRTMVPLATIDGLRAIAARSGDYRPMEDAPVLEFDAAKKDEALNPLGLVRAEVKVWRRFGEMWFPITGEAWWDEYAATGEINGDSASSAAPSGERRIRRLAASWSRMGRVLLAKCAEAQALRRGWPEDLSGLYGEEELHRAELDDLLAHERADRAAEEGRQRALTGSRNLLIAFEPGVLEPVPRADIALKLAAYIATVPDAAVLESFESRNRAALKTFWDWSPGEALDIKAQTERALTRLRADAQQIERDGATERREIISEAAHENSPQTSSEQRPPVEGATCESSPCSAPTNPGIKERKRTRSVRKPVGAKSGLKSQRRTANGVPPRPAA